MGHKLACQWLSSPSKLLKDSAPQPGATTARLQAGRARSPEMQPVWPCSSAATAWTSLCSADSGSAPASCTVIWHREGVGWLGGKQADQGGWLRSLALHRGSLGRITAACMQSCAAIPVHPPHGPGGLPGWPTQKADPQPGQPEPHRQPPGAPACAAGSLPQRSGPAARQLQGWEEGQWVIRGARRTPGNPQQARAHR